MVELELNFDVEMGKMAIFALIENGLEKWAHFTVQSWSKSKVNF